jgi:hypothetical protein
MDYLRENRGEIFGDLLLEDLREPVPEVFGSHVHVVERLSLTKAVNSSIACAVSLLVRLAEGCTVRLVADRGSLSNTREPYTTTT